MSSQQTNTQGIQIQPLVSFIITTYNLPVKMLRACLQSILLLNLLPQQREILLIDNASIISPLDELADLTQHFTYIRLQTNHGVSASRNLGLHKAQGIYIQFVDGDDYLLPSAYNHCLELIKQTNADTLVYQTTKQPKANKQWVDSLEMTGSYYLYHHNIHVLRSYLFKKEIVGNLRFPLDNLHEDEEFTPQLILRSARLYHTTAQAYYYRQRENSISNTKTPEILEKKLHDTLDILLRFQHLCDTISPLEQQALQRRIAQLTMDYIYNVASYTHNLDKLNQAIDQLYQYNLYPLPNKNYTKKYRLFRNMIQTKMGRRFLIALTRK